MRVSVKWMAVGLLLAAGASAQSRWAVVGSGNCDDSDLLQNVRLLRDQLRNRVGNKLLSEEKLREKLPPMATRTAEELSRQLLAVQMLFFQNKAEAAAEQVQRMLVDVARLPVGKERWRLQTELHVLYAVCMREMNHQDYTDKWMSWPLHRDLLYQMDKGVYSGQTRERFESVRKKVLQEKRTRLEVKSQPSGAEVFLDGFGVGKTPLQLELPVSSDPEVSTYQVVVKKEEGVSMPHTVVLKDSLASKEPQSLFVDLQFEGAIHAERVPCLSNDGDEKARLTAALKLATLLEVEQMAVLWLKRHRQGSTWVAATVLETRDGSKKREGSLEVTNSTQAPEGLGELADFILTGLSREHIGKVQANDAPFDLEGAANERSLGLGPTGAPTTGRAADAQPSPAKNWNAPLTRTPPSPSTSGPLLLGQTPPNPTSGDAGTRTWRTPLGLGVIGAGLLFVGVGVVAQLNAAHDWEQFNGYYANGSAPSQLELPLVVQTRQNAQTSQGIALTGFVTGGVALVGGMVLVAGDGGSPSSPVTARLVASPASVRFNLRFP